MRRFVCFCLAILLLSVGLPVSPARSAPSAAQAVESGTTAVARAQNLLLSKGVKGENRDPAIAVDPRTGNVLVVWYQNDPKGGQHVWASLLRRKGSGKYKKPRVRRLSSGVSPQSDLQVGWIEANKEFFVIWDHALLDGGPTVKRIFGVPVNAKTGRRVGKVKTLVADDDNHASPVFVTGLANESGGSRKVGSVGRIVWRREPRSNDNPTMEWASLSDTYELSNRATLPDSQIGFGPIIGALALSGGAARTPASMGGRGAPHCMVTLHVFGSVPHAIIVLVLWRDGEGVDSRTYVDEKRAIMGLRPTKNPIEGKSSFLADIEGNDFANYDVQTPPCQKLEVAHTYRLPPHRVAADFLGPQNHLQLRERPSQRRKDGPVGHLITAEDDGRVYRRAFDLLGNLLDGPETLFSHGNKLTSLIAHNVSSAKSSGKKPNALVVWTKSVGKKSDQEIWAYSFYVEPFE